MTEVQHEKKNGIVDPSDADIIHTDIEADDIKAALEPIAESGGSMKVLSATAPAALFGHKWHPTQAVITIDGKSITGMPVLTGSYVTLGLSKQKNTL